jgi:hypothetical protein
MGVASRIRRNSVLPGLNRLRKNSSPLEKLRGFVTGHEFTRAAKAAESMAGFSPC